MAEYRPYRFSDLEEIPPGVRPKMLSSVRPEGFPVETPEGRREAMSRSLAIKEAERGTEAVTDPEGLERDIARTRKAAGGPAAPTTPAAVPKWSEITSSPKYQALDGAGRESVRMSFWRDVVSPLVPTEELEQVRVEFDELTRPPSLLKRAGEAVKKMFTAAPVEEGPFAGPSNMPGDPASEMPPTELGKGFRAGVAGAHQLTTAAMLVPVVGGIANYS